MATRKLSAKVSYVPIPLRFEKAVETESSDTHTICTGPEGKPHPPARVRNKVTCEACGHVETSVFGYPKRGVERDGQLIEVNAADLKGDPVKTLDLAFHPREKVYGATVAGAMVNNLLPDKGGEAGYALLKRALHKHPDLVAVGVWAPQSANSLWVIEVVDDRLVMSQRAWPEYVRPAPAVAPFEVAEREAKMFDDLVEVLVEDFDLTKYVDESKRKREEAIAAGQAVDMAPTGAPTGAQVIDMMSAIEASLKQAKPTRAAKKAAPRKAPAKKTVAKKATAKKTTTRKRATQLAS